MDRPPPGDGARLHLIGLAVRDAERTRLAPTSLDVGPGEIVALCGPSGSGKSTLLRAVLDRLPGSPTLSGRRVVDGIDLEALRPARRAHHLRACVSALLQDPSGALDPLRPAADALHLAARRAGDPGRATALLDALGLDPALGARPPHRLSGGQRQRLALAAALASGPRLLLLDEPTSALDALSRDGFLSLVRGWVGRTGGSVLLVTHDPAVARAADRRVDLRPPSPPRPPRRRATPPDAPGLVVEGLTVRHPTSATDALRDVTLSIPSGGIAAIVGRSGSGKSTLARAVLGLIPDPAGRMAWRGRDLAALRGAAPPADLRRAVQGVLQDPIASFPPRATVRETLAVARRHHGLPAEGLDALAGRVGLDARLLDRRPHALSGGEAQRAALVRALSLGPALLVADELTSALDASHRDDVLDALADWVDAEGATLALVTHDLEAVARVADTVVVLEGGQVLDQGPLEVLRRRAVDPVARALLGVTAD